LTCSNNLPYVIDVNGCKKCECRECPAPTCTLGSTTANSNCPLTERFLKDGCPGCDCMPRCTNFCENGYEYADSSNTGVVDCKCKCIQKPCEPCEGGFKTDTYGCPTCDCIPVYNGCLKVPCNQSCEYGVVYEGNCPKCECNVKPPCPAVLCAENKCVYGTSVNALTKCPTCDCIPCKPVECPRYCEFGFGKVTGGDGCSICICNEKPVCSNTGSAVCPLDCGTLGLTTVNGCPDCQSGCNKVEPCQCPSVPVEEPKLCSDGVSYPKYTGDCKRTTDNKCYLVRIECPIVIIATLKGTLTEAQFAEIKANNGITNDLDVTTTKETNADGTTKYTFFIKKEGLATGKTAEEVNKEVETQAKKVDDNAVSFVLQENANTPGNFGSLLVPLFCLLAFILF